MKSRATPIVFAVVATVGIGSLLAAAAMPRRWTTFSANVPAASLLVTLAPGQEVCQGPIAAPAFGALEAWVWPTPNPGPALALSVRDLGTRRPLATGDTQGGYSELTPPTGYPSPVTLSSTLNAVVPGGRRVAVCLRSQGPGRVTLMGSHVVRGSGTLSSTHSKALALVLLSPHRESLLSQLPTIFGRAALFRPGWVGAWTFWAAAVALLAAFALAGIAVSRASQSA